MGPSFGMYPVEGIPLLVSPPQAANIIARDTVRELSARGRWGLLAGAALATGAATVLLLPGEGTTGAAGVRRRSRAWVCVGAAAGLEAVAAAGARTGSSGMGSPG
jgi:hypothetical protein